ncbi:MAG: 2OG-Fe(II) oxygenase [Planctomycetes bacterium]|nr:2OG-Fe(II) oxygenase [Planctomycetota bacterium]
MSVYTETDGAFEPAYLRTLERQILASRHLAADNLNRDFIGTRGFSVVFRGTHRERVEREFPYFTPYLARALRDDCNAFYLNPLLLAQGSRVDPHIDRSLRAYAPTIVSPRVVSVLYVVVPEPLVGGALVLSRNKRALGRVRPAVNKLVVFGGDLTHAVERVDSPGRRLSLVCEQYQLTAEELAVVPEYLVERRARQYD